MKQLLFILFFQLSFNSISQSDFRNLKWGMTIEEVQNAESPLAGNIERNLHWQTNNTDNFQLTYDNISIDNFNVSIYYFFNQGLLSKAIIRYNYSTNENNSNLNLATSFKGIYSYINSLNDKNFNILGWIGVLECLGLENAKKSTNEILKKVEFCSNKMSFNSFILENQNTNIEILIPTKSNIYFHSKQIGNIKFQSKKLNKLQP